MARSTGPISTNRTGRDDCEHLVSAMGRFEKRNGRYGM